MLDQRHLGDEIGGRDQFGLGVAAGDDDVQIGATRAQRRRSPVRSEIVVAQRDVEFVEHDQADRRIGHQFAALAQARSAAAMSRLRSCVSQVKPSPIVCQTT